MHNIITDYMEKTAEKFPEKIAVVDEKRELSFSELRAEVRKIATRLIDEGIFHKPVAVFLEQSVEAVVCFLAVAYSGNFYTVLDTKMPKNRLQKIMQVLKPAAILTDNAHFTDISVEVGTEVKVITYDASVLTAVDNNALKNVSRKINPMDVLYVLFTSGSTGVPKGVTVGQRSVMEYTEWVSETFKVNEHEIIGNQAPFYFDNSVLDIYQMVSTGATLHIIPRSLFKFPLRLLEYIRDNSINMVFWVPSVLCMVANFDVLEACDVSCLKKILFAGEVMPNKQLNVWRRALPKALFANLYGPTEITVDCTYYIVDRAFDDAEPLPIGVPCRASTILVLDDKNQLVKGSNQGELCVRGSSLSYGYYRDPERTAQAFMQNPLNDAYRDIIYRTGDLVHYNERNEIMYDGRKDFQVKHMGHRIELGEIETAVSAQEGIEASCCLFDGEKSQLILCYIGKLEERELRKKLIDILPEYMRPRYCRKLEVMPINANGKIDRKRLYDIQVRGI